MVGPVPYMARVPLQQVLPHEYLDAEGELRRYADEFDSHPVATDRGTWHWYPEHRTRPAHIPGQTFYLLIVDTTITLYDTRDDWLELTLDIAWRTPSMLTVNAAVEVACWCPQNHNMHQVRRAQWQAVNSLGLVEGFAAGTAWLTEVLAAGPFEPRTWRTQAGLPDASDGAT